MKLKFTLSFVLFALFSIGANSQTYYQGDINALNALSASTGQEYFLNWYQAPPQYWEGVTWWLDVEGQMFRVSGLNLANKNISGNLVVKDLYYLTSLQCQNNSISQLNISNTPNLSDIICHNNNLTTLSQIITPGLENLDCSYNQFTTLDLSNYPNLRNLNCDNTQLLALFINNNLNLAYISCNSNNLNSVDLSNNRNLIEFNCDVNSISILDVSNNSELKSLSCGRNKLNTLNLSNNPKIESVICSYNNFNTLNFSNNPMLKTLFCQRTYLKNLILSSNHVLSTVNCSDNNLPISDLLQVLNPTIDRSKLLYYPQHAVFNEAVYSTNVTLDYSAQADGGNTLFYFRNRSKPGFDGSEVVAINRTGIYTTQGNGVYFCEMANPKLNQNNFYSHTVNTTIDLSGNSSLKSMSLAEAPSAPISDENIELIKTYPNPVVDVINAELPNDNIPATITLYSMDGKQLKKVETTSAKTTISMEDLERGNYIIEVKSAKEKIKRKIVKL